MKAILFILTFILPTTLFAFTDKNYNIPFQIFTETGAENGYIQYSKYPFRNGEEIGLLGNYLQQIGVPSSSITNLSKIQEIFSCGSRYIKISIKVSEGNKIFNEGCVCPEGYTEGNQGEWLFCLSPEDIANRVVATTTETKEGVQSNTIENLKNEINSIKQRQFLAEEEMRKLKESDAFYLNKAKEDTEKLQKSIEAEKMERQNNITTNTGITLQEIIPIKEISISKNEINNNLINIQTGLKKGTQFTLYRILPNGKEIKVGITRVGINGKIRLHIRKIGNYKLKQIT